jgi:O-acetylhomoserine/O-acetylserine sulfhydrylase-like pyridoxal-dependent enzyme
MKIIGSPLAGPNRILRVMVDERKTGIDAAASIAHELQHALEVLQVPDIKTAAVRVTDTVHSELNARSKGRGE